MNIGFIDYYIDEWHANNYPDFIRQSPLGARMKVTHAWDQGPQPGKKPLDQWCRDMGVTQARTVEEVIAKCDAIIVLAPDNVETHEALADLPLRSGKPVYIDKPVAPSRAAAKRLFDKAAAHKTPMFSSSALRFSSELHAALSSPLKNAPPDFISTRGGGDFSIYAIHQYEMIVKVMGVGAQRVMMTSSQAAPGLAIDYGNGRFASMNVAWGHPFQLSAAYKGTGKEAVVLNQIDDFFPQFIEAMLTFFETRQSPVRAEETLEVAGLIEAGEAALKRPFEWVAVGR
ncbi:MAG: Gfo/Idh/MocA family oxidoreductase [Phycisphaeraceae bacterium]|nr:Gfo/Idh/MocA family oxidoreductase [Phycisphaeraceae bacterium]